MSTERPADWPERLAAVLKMASVRRFDPREWNCARFAHACAEAVTGCTLPYQFIGSSLEASVNAVLPRIDPRVAQRGDVVLADLPHPTIGVCLGATCAFLTFEGLVTHPRQRINAAWKV